MGSANDFLAQRPSVELSESGINPHVARHIVACRERELLSQEELAERLSLPTRNIRDYESGQGDIPAMVLWTIADELHEPIDAFYPARRQKLN